MQFDTSLHVFDWPVRIECIECGDAIKLSFTSEGLIPQIYNVQKPQDRSVLTTVVGYSAALPITSNLYMQECDAIMSMLNFSPYMNLLRESFSSHETKEFETFCHRLNENLLPYRSSMKELLPILKKGNVKAFSRKMATIFEVEKYQELDSYEFCRDAFNKLIHRSYQNLCTIKYNSQVVVPYVNRLFHLVSEKNINELDTIKMELDKCTCLSDWLDNEAYPYVAEMLSDIQEFIPAMIYASVDNTGTANRGNLNIVTITHDNAVKYYTKGYEVLVHGLPLIVGLTNLLENGNIHKFVNLKMNGITDLKAFSSLSGGLMEEKLQDYNSVDNYLFGSMEHKLRNAGIHNGVKYEALTQNIECHYDLQNENKIYNTRLIEVCYKSYIQLLHILEITLLTYLIVKKTKK